MKTSLPTFLLVGVLVFALATTQIEAKKKKHKSSSSFHPSSKTKTKTKWSTSTDIGQEGANAMVATEEHGYYVKRTFIPVSANRTLSNSRQTPPYLAIPIAWFSCGEGSDCHKGNSLAINGATVFTDGYLCDDDCTEPYEPLCAKTTSEVAVFYNKCKLSVAKCRSHGLWIDLPYNECKKSYAKELEYTDKKFRSSPFFKDAPAMNETVLNIALEEIDEKIKENETHQVTEKVETLSKPKDIIKDEQIKMEQKSAMKNNTSK